jgi:hypothetical protein
MAVSFRNTTKVGYALSDWKASAPWKAHTIGEGLLYSAGQHLKPCGAPEVVGSTANTAAAAARRSTTEYPSARLQPKKAGEASACVDLEQPLRPCRWGVAEALSPEHPRP